MTDELHDPDDRENAEADSKELTAVQLMARDLGLDPQSIGAFDLKEILKIGPNSTLFIARISQVYYETSHLQRELRAIRKELEAERRKREQAEARVVALERTKVQLENRVDFHSTRA